MCVCVCVCVCVCKYTVYLNVSVIRPPSVALRYFD